MTEERRKEERFREGGSDSELETRQTIVFIVTIT